MQTTVSLDRIDSRLALWVYAVAAWVAGLFVALWGVIWIHGSLDGQTYGGYAFDGLVRVGGTMIVAAGCCAAALAMVDNPVDRRRAVGWFAAGHFIVVGMALLQRMAVWSPGPVEWLVRGVVVAAVALFYVWMRAAGDPRPRFGGILLHPEAQTVAERLRSEYEDHIRDAAAQEERNRLARDLHDSVKQQIFAIQTAAATAQTRFDVDPDGAKAALANVRASAREATGEMEAMLDQLRAAPIENAGLVEALKKQCDALKFRTGAEVDFTVSDLPPNAAVPPGARQAILRIAQEALANVARHARARHVTMALSGTDPSRLVLSVADDGAGFDEPQPRSGMGLGNMRARAEEAHGTLDVASSQGGGTTVTLSVPVMDVSAADYRKKLLWSSPFAAILFALLLLDHYTRQTSRGWLWVFAIGAVFDLTRYALAWVRASRLSRGRR